MARPSRSRKLSFPGALFKPIRGISLKGVCLAGFCLSLLLCGALIPLIIYSGGSLFSGPDFSEEDTFYRDLRQYDTLLARSPPPENPQPFNTMLDRLEKKALGVESHMAVLKRRRALAFRDPRFYSPYREAARRVAGAFPYSQPLAALALEALLRENSGTEEDLAGETADYAGRISEARLRPLVLARHILSGGMKDPATAAALPNLEALFTLTLPLLPGERFQGENEGLVLDLTILRALKGDLAGAAARLADMLPPSPGGEPAAPETLRFAAEFFYNYGNPRRAAELFARFSDPGSLSRQADALWLADLPGGAQNIWTVLTAPQEPGQAGIDPEIRARSLYNLAASAPDQTEEAAWLNRLLAEGRPRIAPGSPFPSSPGESSYVYGIIRYTRLLDGPRARAILEEGELRSRPLLDLELLRRRGETWPVDRTIAEAWLLLGRHPEDERLYQWAAYFFDYQRRYGETAQLLKTAGYRGITGPWADLHTGLSMIREGNLAGAEEQFKTIPPSAGIWQAPANTARLLEARRSPAAALESYETAAAMVKDGKSAAEIQLRIAQCLRTLGRERESRRVLEYALDMDPENLNARLELRRLDFAGAY
jgi:tetratricopeptide (TPR) repeat protein